MSHREYDVLLYGASGFVGRQTVKYFAEHPSAKGVRWAIAGRDHRRLETVKAQVGGAAKDVDIWAVDSRNQAAVDDIVARTKAVLRL